MGHPHAMCTLIPMSVLRHLTLARLGFRCDRSGAWRRGAIVITEERLDAMSARSFAARVRHWRRASA
jgi:hypothetical protein